MPCLFSGSLFSQRRGDFSKLRAVCPFVLQIIAPLAWTRIIYLFHLPSTFISKLSLSHWINPISTQTLFIVTLKSFYHTIHLTPTLLAFFSYSKSSLRVDKLISLLCSQTFSFSFTSWNHLIKNTNELHRLNLILPTTTVSTLRISLLVSLPSGPEGF